MHKKTLLLSPAFRKTLQARRITALAPNPPYIAQGFGVDTRNAPGWRAFSGMVGNPRNSLRLFADNALSIHVMHFASVFGFICLCMMILMRLLVTIKFLLSLNKFHDKFTLNAIS